MKRSFIFGLMIAVFSSCNSAKSEKRFPSWNNLNFSLRVKDLPIILVVGTGGKRYNKFMKYDPKGIVCWLSGVATLKQLLALPDFMKRTKKELLALLKQRGVAPKNRDGLALVTEALRVLYPTQQDDIIVYWMAMPLMEPHAYKHLPVKNYKMIVFEAYEVGKGGVANRPVSSKEAEEIAQSMKKQGMEVRIKHPECRLRPPPYKKDEHMVKDIRFGDMWFHVIFYEVPEHKVTKCIALPGIVVFDLQEFISTFGIDSGLWAVYFPAKNFFWDNPDPGDWEW